MQERPSSQSPPRRTSSTPLPLSAVSVLSYALDATHLIDTSLAVSTTLTPLPSPSPSPVRSHNRHCARHGIVVNDSMKASPAPLARHTTTPTTPFHPILPLKPGEGGPFTPFTTASFLRSSQLGLGGFFSYDSCSMYTNLRYTISLGCYSRGKNRENREGMAAVARGYRSSAEDSRRSHRQRSKSTRRRERPGEDRFQGL